MSKAIFEAMPEHGRLTFNTKDARDYLLEKEGVPQYITMQDADKISKKLKMYNYLYKVVYPAAVNAFRHHGYEGANTAWVDHKLKSWFAMKSLETKEGETDEYYPEDKGSMSKDRLHKYLSDCIFFVEKELDCRVPDATEYKIYQQSGRKYKKIK